MIIFIPVIIIIFWIFICNELMNLHFHGKFISDEKLESFLGKYLQDYELNECSKQPDMLWNVRLPYITKIGSVFSKWKIYDSGMVPRWSKWSKEIDKKVTQELPTYRSKQRVRGIDAHI